MTSKRFSSIRIVMTSVDAREGTVLTEEQRRLNLIAYVRSRISPNPNTLVSYYVGNPEVLGYSLRFNPDEHTAISIDAWSNYLRIERKKQKQSSGFKTVVEVTAKGDEKDRYLARYTDFEGLGILDGEEGLVAAEKRIEEFLPPPESEQPIAV